MHSIIFSRHAKRRLKLYKLSENTVVEIIGDAKLTEGRNIIIKRISANKYPLKIVVEVAKAKIIVVTNYPLKKGLEK